MKRQKKSRILENPIMTDKKNIKGMNIKDISEDSVEIKSFIIIVVVISVLIGAIYGLTELIKKEPAEEEKITAGTINYDKLTVGTLLNRPYEEYYVLVYNSEDNNAVLYSTILSKYTQKNDKKDYIKIYYCDLANSLNAKYYNVGEDDKSNPNAKNIEELDFGKVTLLKIKNGKINMYFEDISKIKETLK